jgi:hypothetical protein
MKPLLKKKNKKGAFGIIVFFIVLLSILIIGFIMSGVVAILDFGSDTITPVMEDLGVVGGTNLSDVGRQTFGVMDSFVQALPWLIGFAYVLALIFSIVFVVSYGYNPSAALIGLYFVLMILLIVASIILSNMYENIYTGTDEIATRMKEQTLLAYMILYSPMILTIIAFIAGIFMFAGRQNEMGGFSGI